MSITENFTNFYNDIRDTLQEKTSFQSLHTEEIIQVMQIAASLTCAYELRGINEALEYHFGKAF